MATTRILITQYIVFPAQKKLCVYYSDNLTGGTNLYAELSESATPLDKPGYTDADICAALSTFLEAKGVKAPVAMEPVPVPEPGPLAEDEDAG